MSDSTSARPLSAIVARPPLPLLVTGVSGVAGFNTWQTLRSLYGDRVWGLCQLDNRRLNHSGVVRCDIEDPIGLARAFRDKRFAAVLDCGGNCALRSCELDPAMAWRINFEATANLLATLRRFPARLVRWSIDLVYSGRGTGGHAEGDATDPVTVYGQSMAAAEELVLGSELDSCVARISLPMGPSPNGHAGAIDWIESRFRKGKPATLYYDEIRTPTYTDCLTRVACGLLRADFRGLVHVGGPRRLSLYQIAQIVNRVGGYPPHLLHGCFRNEAGPIPPRAGNVSLDSSRLRQLDTSLSILGWPYDERLVPDHPDWHWERGPLVHADAAWHGSRQLLERVLYRSESLPPY